MNHTLGKYTEGPSEFATASQAQDLATEMYESPDWVFVEVEGDWLIKEVWQCPVSVKHILAKFRDKGSGL